MKRLTIILSLMCLAIAQAMAQDNPSINPTAEFTDSEQKTEEGTEYSGSAPVVAHFKANASNVGAWNAYYEWRFWQEGEDGSKDSPYLIRYEEDTDYTFTKAGTHSIVLHAIFTQGNDTIAFTQDYWDEVGPLRVTISESKLDMPNGFSPNGDGINDIYKAKEGYQSLVEFRAIIFNRWGQKIYEWTDPADGWDGTFHGQDVKQGTYFVDVVAKGADGRRYHIRRDVNLLRGYSETGSSSGGGGGSTE